GYWWLFDQVEPTLLIYTVWSAIDLVPSWTKKINPRASDNRPTNRRTKRIMAFYARKTCIARLSLTPLARPVQSARTTCRWGRAAAAARTAAQAGWTTDSTDSIGLALGMGIRSVTFGPPASPPGGI